MICSNMQLFRATVMIANLRYEMKKTELFLLGFVIYFAEQIKMECSSIPIY